MSEDSDNVKKLPVRFKNPVPDDRTLLFPYEVGKHTKCYHEKFVVDEAKAEVECGSCGEKLNPMWVLRHLTGRDTRFAEAHRKYHEEMKRLSERERTKCEHCGKMTGISRR
jgi:Zn finger protein HypA/HybF involved in hydrogenase expression